MNNATTIQPHTYVKNTQTGKIAFCTCINVVRHDGQRIVQVSALRGGRRWWLEAHTVPAAVRMPAVNLD